MKIFTNVFLFIFFIANGYSQNDSFTAYEKYNSSGSILNISANPFTNDYGKSNLGVDRQIKDYKLNLDFSMWNFSRRFNAGVYVNSFASYYEDNEIYENEAFNIKSRTLAGTLYTGADFYPFKSDVYFTGSFGSIYVLNKVDRTDNIFLLSSSGNGSFNLFWGGLGFGRLVDNTLNTDIENFEMILSSEKLLGKKLNSHVKERLFVLFNQRNNRDFISKFKDNSDAEFFDRVEKLLIEEKVIETSLNAKTTIELYETLTNRKFILYPHYSGGEVQLTLQQQLNKNSIGNFLTLGGIAGKKFDNKTSILFSGFGSMTLNDSANINYLFSYFSNPFFDYTQIKFNQYQLQYTNYLYTRLFENDINSNQSFIYGLKTILFKNISSFAGIRPYIEYIGNIPKNGKINNLINIGIGGDYNIFSRLILSFLAETNISNKYKPKYYYSLGFSINIF